jgi:hypothetical protein
MNAANMTNGKDAHDADGAHDAPAPSLLSFFSDILIIAGGTIFFKILPYIAEGKPPSIVTWNDFDISDAFVFAFVGLLAGKQRVGLLREGLKWVVIVFLGLLAIKIVWPWVFGHSPSFLHVLLAGLVGFVPFSWVYWKR